MKLKELQKQIESITVVLNSIDKKTNKSQLKKVNRIHKLKTGRFIDLSQIVSISEVKRYFGNRTIPTNCFEIDCILLHEKILIIDKQDYNKEGFKLIHDDLVRAWENYNNKKP